MGLHTKGTCHIGDHSFYQLEGTCVLYTLLLACKKNSSWEPYSIYSVSVPKHNSKMPYNIYSVSVPKHDSNMAIIPPKFSDPDLAGLKQVMLTRLPGCHLTPIDVDQILSKTKLNHYQVKKWAEHFRRQYQTLAERSSVLHADSSEDSEVVQESNRMYFSCFGVGEPFVLGLEGLKLGVTHYKVALHESAGFAEGVIHFTQDRWENDFIDQLRLNGASQVTVNAIRSNDAVYEVRVECQSSRNGFRLYSKEVDTNSRMMELEGEVEMYKNQVKVLQNYIDLTETVRGMKWISGTVNHMHSNTRRPF